MDALSWAAVDPVTLLFTRAQLPRLPVRTRSGRWAALHASWMSATATAPSR
ncbi:hypothetical protein [Amnibacterium sp.]|uniref:hypothetical protein n=1 Tax=Amnibacterium sp. TaxID=1872496 RepID=UPI00260E5DF5|nr:hypothetical protein [Amnibacterium sp.]